MIAESEGITTRERFRIGRRTGQKLWQIKEAPGWKVVHQAETLHACGEWLKSQGFVLTNIPVLTSTDWKMLQDWLRSGKEPS